MVLDMVGGAVRAGVGRGMEVMNSVGIGTDCE